MAKLKIGDKVRGTGVLSDMPIGKVTNIEVCKTGSKYGKNVDSVDWSNQNVVVDLDNGHWAKIHQIKPLRTNKRRVWVLYYRKTENHFKVTVDIIKVKYPDRTKSWKRLQSDLGKYHSIGFELLKDFDETT